MHVIFKICKLKKNLIFRPLISFLYPVGKMISGKHQLPTQIYTCILLFLQEHKILFLTEKNHKPHIISFSPFTKMK